MIGPASCGHLFVMPRRHTIAWVLLFGLLAACEEDEPGEVTCSLALSLSGDASDALTSKSSLACAISHSGDAGIDVGYLQTSGAIKSVDLSIAAITKGETGAGFPATLTIHHSDDRSWKADECTVSVTDHAFREAVEFGDAYHVVGTGECASPALDDEGGSVTVAPFKFIVHAIWSD